MAQARPVLAVEALLVGGMVLPPPCAVAGRGAVLTNSRVGCVVGANSLTRPSGTQNYTKPAGSRCETAHQKGAVQGLAIIQAGTFVIGRDDRCGPLTSLGSKGLQSFGLSTLANQGSERTVSL